MYKRHRFPPEIIQHVVWLYHRFNLSSRDIEDFIADRGIAISYESIRLWCIKFRSKYSKRLRRQHQGYGDTFYLGEILWESEGYNTISGALSPRMGKRLLCSHSAAGTDKQQNASSSACCKRVAKNQYESSPTRFEATVWLIGN